MHDPFVRFALLSGILGTTAVGGSIYLVWHMRRMYWKKLRQAGDPRAKEREMMRQRKRR